MIIFNIKTKDAWSQYQAKTNVKGIARIKTAAAGRANRSQLMAVSGLRGRIPALRLGCGVWGQVLDLWVSGLR